MLRLFYPTPKSWRNELGLRPSCRTLNALLLPNPSAGLVYPRTEARKIPIIPTGDILAPLAPLGLLSGNMRGTRGAIAGCALSRDSSDPCAARPHVFGPERSGARISWGRKVAIWGPRFFDGTARAASLMT